MAAGLAAAGAVGAEDAPAFGRQHWSLPKEVTMAGSPVLDPYHRGFWSMSKVNGILSAAGNTDKIVALRCHSNWGDVEAKTPVGGVHTYTWSGDDWPLDLLSPFGLRWIPTLGTGGPPSWALTGDLITDVTNFAAYCAAFAQRYGSNGTFWAAKPSRRYVPVTEVEILSEPDFSPRYSLYMTDYAALFTAAYDAIKAVQPTMRVVHGGMATYGTRYSNFLSISGIKARLGDGLNCHAYPTTPDQMATKLTHYLALFTSKGYNCEPIIFSEYGWSLVHVNASPQPNPDTPAQQNANFTQATATLLNNSGSPGMIVGGDTRTRVRFGRFEPTSPACRPNARQTTGRPRRTHGKTAQ